MRRIFIALMMLCLSVAAQAQTQPNAAAMPFVKIQFASSSGAPLVAGKLFTYAAGATTPLETYSTSCSGVALTSCTQNANPVVLDSGGRAFVFLGPSCYKFIAQNAAGTQQWTVDNICDLALLFRTNFATKVFDQVCHASQYTGTTPNDAGGKTAYCINSVLPSSGGTVDDNGLQGAQIWTACPFTGVTKPVTVRLSGSTISLPVSCTIPANVTLELGQGAVFSVAPAMTLTINGIFGGMSTSLHFSGSGTTTINNASALLPNWFVGGDAGAMIAKACAALPSTGGTIDAAPLSGVQAVTTSISCTAPTRLYMGASTYTFSASGAIVMTACGSSLNGMGNGITIFKPTAAYTGTFVTVQAGSCINQFGYNYGVRLANFLILDGNDNNDGTGRTAAADGILLRDSDSITVENVSVRALKGTSLRLRNVRESTLSRFYSFAGGTAGKPSVWLGNTFADTLTSDCNNLSFYDLRVIYPYERGMLIATANATSLMTGEVVGGVRFYGGQFEGRAVDLSGAAADPAVFNIIELPGAGTATQAPSNNISFDSSVIVNWNINNAVAGLWVGYGSAGSVIQHVTLTNAIVGGYQSQVPAASTGVGVKVDYVETMEVAGGLFNSGSALIANLNVTANATRVYVSPTTRFIQAIGDPNGTGITGTTSKITGVTAPVGGTETFNYPSQNIQVANAVGNPNSGTANIRVSTNGGAAIITSDANGVGYLAIRSKVGGGGVVTADSDRLTALKFGSVAYCASAASPAVCSASPTGYVVIAAAATTVVVNTTAVSGTSQIFITEDTSNGATLGVTCNATAGRVYAVTAKTAATSFTITSNAAPAANPACLAYWILN